MAAVDPSTPTPGERRRSLDRPPGERYAPAATADEPPPRRGAAVPAWLAAVLIALAGAAITVLLAGVLSLSAGLLLVAGGTGWFIGRALGGPASGARSARGRALAIGLAAASVLLGHVGLWLFARSEGGALGPVDYLAQTWGPLAVAQYVVAVVAAWLASR
jgi:hypothetical protein